jgi:hypothetical protein
LTHPETFEIFFSTQAFSLFILIKIIKGKKEKGKKLERTAKLSKKGKKDVPRNFKNFAIIYYLL